MKLTNASEIFSVLHKVANLKQLRQGLYALILFFVSIPFACSTTYYVATSGNDGSSGLTLSAPFKTITKAMNRATAGDTVYVRGGVYREQVDVGAGGGSAGRMVSLRAYNSEMPIIKGSDVVTGWTLYSGKIWKRTNWAYNSQQVFVGGGDSPSLQQIGMPGSFYSTYNYPKPVGNGVGSMVPGSFYYDRGSSTLYVWLADGSNPNTKYMEASVRRRLLYLNKPYIYVKGFVFRHSNASAFSQTGAAVELSSNSILEQCDIQYTDFTGLSMGYQQTGSVAQNVNVSNNGNTGVTAASSYNFRISNSRLNQNNTRNFYQDWVAGGLKATGDAYGTVENSEAGYNNGSGIWFDYTNGGGQIVVRNNYIHNNGPLEAAIFMEVSKNVLIYNNVVANNQRRGIYIASSDNTRVYNNTIYATKGYAGIEIGGMPRSGATLTYNSVRNNSISHGSTTYDLLIATPNGSSITGNTSDYNNFYRPSGAIQLYMGKMYNSVPGFSAATKLDVHSINANPGFLDSSSPNGGSSFAVNSSSPIINRGTAVSGVATDFLYVSRAQGPAYDIGAFEK